MHPLVGSVMRVNFRHSRKIPVCNDKLTRYMRYNIREKLCLYNSFQNIIIENVLILPGFWRDCIISFNNYNSAGSQEQKIMNLYMLSGTVYISEIDFAYIIIHNRCKI